MINKLSKLKNVIITHVYSKDNAGDAAILSIQIKNILDNIPDAKIKILTMDSIYPNELFEGNVVENSFMYFALYSHKNKIIKLVDSIFIICTTLLWAYIYKYFCFSIPIPKKIRKICEIYAQADLIIPVGGGYLRGNKNYVTSIFNILLLVHPLKFSHILGIPTIMYTQSVGPFFNRIERCIVRHSLNHYVKAISIREDISIKCLNTIGVKKSVFFRSVDAGFELTTQDNNSVLSRYIQFSKQSILVGITARKWLALDEQKIFENVLSQTIDYIVTNYNSTVVLIPQVTAKFHNDDDRLVHKNIYSKVINKDKVALINDQLNFRELKTIFNSIDFLIGTRFHSIIFALTSRIPSIAIEYEYKTSGIMRDLGLSKWVVNIHDVTNGILIELFDKLIANKNDFTKTLDQILPRYIKTSKDTLRILVSYIK